MPPRCEVREVSRVFERSGFENRDVVYDNGRMIVEEGHLDLKDEIKISARRHLAPSELEKAELCHDGQKLDAAGIKGVSIPVYDPNRGRLNPR